MKQISTILSVAAIVALGATKSFAAEAASLIQLDLTGECESCDLSGAALPSEQLVGAILNFSDLSFSDLKLTNLSDAQMEGANMYSAEAAGAQFTRANLIITNFYNADLTGADLSLSNLRKSDLRKLFWRMQICTLRI